MSKTRFFNLFVVMSLLVLAALLIGQFARTVEVVSAAPASGASSLAPANREACSLAYGKITSIQGAYDRVRSLWLVMIDGSPLGREIGLLELRGCSPVE